MASQCDEQFQKVHLNDDQDKVKQAGQHISSEGVTQDLAEWWDGNDEINSWNDFKSGIKSEALGRNWLAHALEDFYTTRQEGTSVRDYIKSLEDKRSVVNEGGHGKLIDDNTFKCHMLFNAATPITTKIMNDGPDLVKTTLTEVKRKIIRISHQSVRETTNASSSIVKSPTGTNGYILLDPWGIKMGNVFSDISNLPFLAKNLGPTTKVTIKSNNHPNKYMIQAYQFDFLGSDSVSLSMGHQNVTRELGLADGEYIASVTITATRYMYKSANGVDCGSLITSLSSMKMMTSTAPPRAISLGTDAANDQKAPSAAVETVMFKAPSGWRIVGFHGSYGYHTCGYFDNDIVGGNRHPIVGLGAILAPVNTVSV